MPQDNEWDNLFTMLDDIHAHVRVTGRPVDLDDDPRHLQFGYEDRTAGKSWRIRISQLKRSLMGVERTEKMTMLLELFRTAEGRIRAANFPLSEAVAV